MNNDGVSINDERLKSLVHGALSARLQEHPGASFQKMWRNAQDLNARSKQSAWSIIWLQRAMVPAVALALIAIMVYFQRPQRLPVEVSIPITTELRLPTDSLLKAAQYSYITAKATVFAPKINLTKPGFPTDSLKWSTQ